MSSPGARNNNVAELVLLSAILFLLSAIVYSGQLTREIESRVRDSYVRLQPRTEGPSNIVLVLIDDRSLQEYGRWPWSRALLAQVVHNASEAQARVIGLDILLSEPQSTTTDRALADAMQLHSRTVIVDKIGMFPDGPHWLEPLPVFRHAASVGHAHAVLDSDGVCRRFPLTELSTDGVRYAFSVEVARQHNPMAAQSYLRYYGLDLESQNTGLMIAKPTLVPIAYSRTEFHTISAADVLRKQRLHELAGRAVLIGFGPTEISDRLTTPLANQLPTPGVEINAQILNSILNGSHILEVSPWWSLAAVLAVAPALVYCFRMARGWKSPIVAIGLAIALYVCGYLALRFAGLSVAIVPLITSTVFAPVIVYAADFVTTERRLSTQLRDLHRWLNVGTTFAPETQAQGIFGQLSEIGDLQAELGSLYELHDKLLEATEDAVAVFDADGTLIFQNRRFGSLFPHSTFALTLHTLRVLAKIGLSEEESRQEVSLGGELYAVRFAALPFVSMAKRGGTVVTFSSLKMRVERDRARAEAIRFVTHELRTPIVAIQGFAELMLRRPGSSACEKAPETIFRESQRLVVLINSYLDVLRIESGFSTIRHELLQIDDLIVRTIELLEPLAQAAQMTLSFTRQSHSSISGDKALLAGAVLNLVSNALKYGRPGTEVEIASTVNDSSVSISVYNQAPPVPPDEFDVLFDLNYRSVANAQSEQGWGIGLAFVKRIAENHGGSVHAENVRDGVCFTLQLPVEAVGAAMVQE